MEKFYVIEIRDDGIIYRPEFVRTVLFSGTKSECLEFATNQRKKYRNNPLVDCFIQSENGESV